MYIFSLITIVLDLVGWQPAVHGWSLCVANLSNAHRCAAGDISHPGRGLSAFDQFINKVTRKLYKVAELFIYLLNSNNHRLLNYCYKSMVITNKFYKNFIIFIAITNSAAKWIFKTCVCMPSQL